MNETESTGQALVPSPVNDFSTIREYLHHRAKSYEESRNKTLAALKTLPKAMLDLKCEDLVNVGIYI